MTELHRQDLMSLEQYAGERAAFRGRVMAHKKHRRVSIGPDLTLYFEDRLTIQYQVQEMLRIERIFDADGIEEELAAYNPLIPNGSNWKATAMLEYEDVDHRKLQLSRLKGIEHLIWVVVDGHERVYAIANEDLERSNDEKTSAVHFLRFELNPKMITSLYSGATLTMGIEHDAYRHESRITEPARSALLKDLQQAN